MKPLPALLLGLVPALALAMPLQQGPPQEGDPVVVPPVDVPPVFGGDDDAGDDDAPRTDRPQGQGNLDIFGRPTRARRARLSDRLLGCWQMNELTLAGSDENGRTAQGFLTVADDFLTLEIHAAWEAGPDGDFAESDIHTTFTAEYVFGEGGLLECSTVIGSYLDEDDGTLQWERPGYRRVYRVEQRSNELILSWGDEDGVTSRMKFIPRFPTVQGRRDVFGRIEAAAGINNQLDLFGRPKKLGGDRDVFGKETPTGTAGGDGEGQGEEGTAPPAGGDERGDG